VTTVDPATRRRAAVALLAARTVYAFSWYNVGAVLPLIQTSLGASTAELGIVLASFLVGAGVFQLPAGLAALRWGGRKLSIVALVVMGVTGTASAFSPNWEVLAVLRFGCGAGAALFFAPALELVSSYFPPGTRGPIIGIYNSGFGLGSGIALFVGALLGDLYGWPSALLVGGLMLLGIAGVLVVELPPEIPPPPRKASELLAVARPILLSRSVWALSWGVGGLWAGYYIAAQFFTQYAKATGITSNLVLAAAVPTVLIASDIVGGPVGGWFAERSADMRRTLLLWSVLSGVLILAIPFLFFAALWPVFVVIGFAEGVVFAILYLYPSYLPEARVEGFAVGLAMMNAIQLFVGSALAFGFGLVAQTAGYTVAWLYAGGVGLVMLVLLLGTTAVRAAGASRDRVVVHR
jgi:MFS family permease